MQSPSPKSSDVLIGYLRSNSPTKNRSWDQHGSSSSCAAKRQHSRAKTAARNRERSRVCMARLREKRRNKILADEQAVRDLLDEIRTLELQKRQLAMGVPTRNSPWCVAAEYFRLFRFGYKAPAQQHQHHVQTNFLRAVMAPDVICGSRYGVEAIVASWEFIMQCCPDFELDLRRIESGVDGSVTAISTAVFTVSRHTLEHAGPQREDSVAKMLGQRLYVGNQLEFHWDDANNRVTMLVVKLDLVTTLLELLGSLEDASRVLAHAVAP